MTKTKRKFGYFFVYVALTLFYSIHLGNGKVPPGLYDENDAVVALNNVTFDSKLVGSASGWIVEFYNSWCGHCINYAPTWKEFASERIGWLPVVQIGAVDCADENNIDLCRIHDIQGVPSFKMFAPGSKRNHPGETFHQLDKRKLEERILDYLTNISISDQPAYWPRLSPIISMQDIWEETKDEHHHVAFIFEDDDSYIGRQVILDTARYRPLLVRRMLRQHVKKFGIVNFPSLYLINRNGTFSKLAAKDNSRTGMTRALTSLLTSTQLDAGDQYLKKRVFGHQPTGQEVVIKSEPVPVPELQDSRAGVYMADLESTLHYSFRQEIAICQHIDGEKLEALKAFVSIISKYLPCREHVRTYLQKIEAWLSTVGSALSGEHWLNTIDRLQTVDSYLPERIEWVGCAGSEPRYRGYPCGMWTLFHTLTVAGYKHNRQNPKDLPVDILSAIQGYMKNFFGCHTCVENFLKMAATLTSADKTPKAAVLWLWQAHNKANMRLHGDKSEDPQHPKVKFPARELCPDCFRAHRFDEESVLKFLVNFYGISAITAIADETGAGDYGMLPVESAVNGEKHLDWWELQQRKKDLEKIRSLREIKLEKNRRKQESKLKDTIHRITGKHPHTDLTGMDFGVKVQRQWSFSNLDMSICFMFYMICTLMIVILYYHFIVRRKYRPCGFMGPSK